MGGEFLLRGKFDSSVASFGGDLEKTGFTVQDITNSV